MVQEPRWFTNSYKITKWLLQQLKATAPPKAFSGLFMSQNPHEPLQKKGRFLSPCCYSGLPAPPAPQSPWTTSSTASGMDKPPGVEEQRYNFNFDLRRKLPKSSMLIRLFWTILIHVEAYWTKKSHEGAGERALAKRGWRRGAGGQLLNWIDFFLARLTSAFWKGSHA